MDPRPHATIRVTRAPVLKPRLAMRQSRGTAWVQPAFPERCFQALFASHEVVFTALAFDCNPTHFVTPQAIPVAHNAFAPQRFVSNCCAPCSASDGSPSDNTATAHSRCKVTPPFRIDPSKGFPVRAALPGPRAFFFVRNSRACLLPLFAPPRRSVIRPHHSPRYTLLQSQVDPSTTAALNGDIHAARAAITRAHHVQRFPSFFSLQRATAACIARRGRCRRAAGLRRASCDGRRSGFAGCAAL